MKGTSQEEQLELSTEKCVESGFPTAGGASGDLVATSAGAVTGGETVRVGHQVGVASTTEAGTYLTTIVYTCVATFEQELKYRQKPQSKLGFLFWNSFFTYPQLS